MRRQDIPELLADITTWPSVDPKALPEQASEVYRQREQAVLAYFSGQPVVQILEQFGIARSTLRWLIKRCLSPHPDGRIQGFRGLIPFNRVKRYVRTQPVQKRAKPGSLGGAFGQLLERLPALETLIERQIRTGALGMTDQGRLYGVIDTQAKLLAACRAAGFSAQDYPLNQDEMAYRSLARWARQRLEEHVRFRLPASASTLWQGHGRPFAAVELDGHKLDLRLRVRFTEPTGLWVDIETERLFVIVLLEVCTRAVLGWHLVIAPEYDRFDVLSTLQKSIAPRRKRDHFAIPGLSYPDGAGFVSEVCPQTAFACWDLLRFDNARAHLSEETLTPLCELIGCRIDAGPVGDPTQRPFIERFFRTLTNRYIQRLPGTTGSSPEDPQGQHGRKLPVDHLILIDELEELLDIAIATYNGTPHSSLHGRTPLEAMQRLLNDPGLPIRTLPPALRSRLHQLQPAHVSTVRGNPARHIAPYISLYGARYSNEILERTTGLLGTSIRVYMNPDDLREVWAYLPNGAELGKLAALSGWRYSRHSLRLRQHILRLSRLGRLKFTEAEDPVLVFADHQRKQSRRSRKEATRLAQALQAVPVSTTEHQPRQRRADGPIVPVELPDLDVQNN